MIIKVSATSANLGPGFDSCGIALTQYLLVEVLGENKDWEVSHDLGKSIPDNEENLLVKTALKLAPDLKPHKLKMKTDIPIAGGLGSSSSVIVAGIELANELSGLNLTENEKLIIATKIEGHPDNVAPAICGGFVVASYIDGQVQSVKLNFPTCDAIAFIPNKELLTKESRGVLPNSLPFNEAIRASSIANVMIAAVSNSDLKLAGKMIEKDIFHERYRGHLVPHLPEVRKISQELGGYGCYLSGAGPTILVLSPPEKTQIITEKLGKLDSTVRIDVLKVDNEGVRIY